MDVYQSELKAKIVFPELFVSSPARDLQRAESENDAARSAAEALDELESSEEKSNESDEGEGGQMAGEPPCVEPTVGR